MKWSLATLVALAVLALSTNVARAQNSTIAGTVMDGTDVSAPAPLIGATVELTSDGGSRTTIITGPDGRYEFRALQSGRYVVSYSSYSLGGETRAINLDTDSRQREIDVCMTPRDLRGTVLPVDADITGVVRDHRTCDILADVMVEAQRLDGQSEPIHSTQTSSNGMYEFNQLDQGNYSVTFNLKDYQEIKVTVDVQAVGAAQPVHAYMLPVFAPEEVVDVIDPSPPIETKFPVLPPVRPRCPSCPEPPPERSPPPVFRVDITWKNGSERVTRPEPPPDPAPPVTIRSNRPER